MILIGNQRSGASDLAIHLLREDENDHVEIHNLRGFMANDLKGALREIEAVAKGTKCVQPLFSLSFNPPSSVRVDIDSFEAAIKDAEARLGLMHQPRAIVFHEKEGRRHCHVVWSRIDVEHMRAINLPYYKTRLNDLSRDLYLEHNWPLPDGYKDKLKRNPLNFTIAEWQQAKRTKQNPKLLKAQLLECWQHSDNRAAFANALEEYGFVLARGDRRGFVAVDWRGEVYSLSRWLDQKPKALKERLGSPKELPSTDEAKAYIAERMAAKIQGFAEEADKTLKEANARKLALREKQRIARATLSDQQVQRADQEAQARAARFSTGLRGIWDWLSGKTRKIKRENEEHADRCWARDVKEKNDLIAIQLNERRALQLNLKPIRNQAYDLRTLFTRETDFYRQLCQRLDHPQLIHEPESKDKYRSRNR